ncbi:MAG: lactonase family protein [Rhodospirillaceae bacterium]|nr:lactonase family protein [Rhodospirillaceae bacterium]
MTTIKTSLLAAAAIAAATMPARAATYVYVGCTDSNEIHVLQLDAKSGDLTPVDKVTIPGITKTAGSTPMASSPDKKLLFAATRGEPMVAASFRIDPATGKLSHIANGPLDGSMAYIATDKTGRWLLAASYPGHKVTVNPIGADGAVGKPQQVIATEPNAHAILPDASNRFVLATSLGGNLVRQFRFDPATGTLTPNDPPAAAVKGNGNPGPHHFAFHPSNGRVYLLNELEASVYVFAWDAKTGTLKEQQSLSALPEKKPEKIWAADLHLSPDGKFLYAMERGTSTIAGFKVDPANGGLALIEHTPTETQPRGFAIDPTGRFLYAVGQLSDSMTSYSIDPASGKLAKLKQFKMGKNPNWVEIVNLP